MIVRLYNEAFPHGESNPMAFVRMVELQLVLIKKLKEQERIKAEKEKISADKKEAHRQKRILLNRAM